MGKSETELSEREIERRRDELAKRMLNMSPRPLKPKSKDGQKASPLKKGERPKCGALGVGETTRGKK
jgi:hypothetical protein